MRHEAIDRILHDRAEQALRQTHLVVDYYRIRRKVAVELPVRQLRVHRFPLRFDGEQYPWAIWLTWDLEERLHRLGAAATVLGHPAAAERADRELAALAAWPRHDQYEKPDLALAHNVRTMLTALRGWPWLGETTRQALREACGRAVDAHVDWYDHDRPGGTPDHPEQRIHHNIPVIGTLALAAAARHLGHGRADDLHRQARAMVLHLLALREEGFTEGVAYDGYVLDFIGDWLEGEGPEVRREVLEHPRMAGWLGQSLCLGAPGNLLAVGEIGDVEPWEMIFHVTALAKVARLAPRPDVAWLLAECDLLPIRTEALAIVRDLADHETTVPPTGAVDAHYAAVLRRGTGPDDLSVVASISRSPMGHGHADAGSIVIGRRGRWWIDDPGYQQYLKTSEREFTAGPRAHNGPWIGGAWQTRRGAGRVRARERLDDGTLYTAIEMTGAYEIEGLERVVRHLWLLENRAVAVADEVRGAAAAPLTWHWYGHRDLAWWVEPEGALLYHDGAHLHVGAPQVELDESMVDRLAGSRGQLTLTATRAPAAATSVTWWLFDTAGEPEAPAAVDDGSCRWLGRELAPGAIG